MHDQPPASGGAADQAVAQLAELVSGRTAASDDSAERLAQLAQRVNRLSRELRLAIQHELAGWAGSQFGSLQANRQVVATIHQLLDNHGLRVRCPECGHAAILRCSPRPGASAGVFVFDHTIQGRRTFHGGGSTLPELRLTSKPPRRKP